MRRNAILLTATLTALAGAHAAGTPVDLSKGHTLYIANYSHLDTEWCWTYRHSILQYIPNTLTENFALFDRYPDYVFNWTGSNRYRFMKEYYPAEYARLKGYVAAGRWVPTGSACDEGDADVPSSESIIRQILYSNRFFGREFGKTSDYYMMPDTFGFPASLPTILAHCGIKGFSTKKLTYGAGAAVGVPFNVGRWVGVDGQSVIAALNPGDYRTRVTDDLSQNKTWFDRIDANGKASGVYADYAYIGNGDEGGSPGAASTEWLEKSLKGTGPVRVIAGDAAEMFNDVTPEQAKGLPSYQGDLLLIQHSAGSINSGATMKRWNARNEGLAAAAERASVAATWLGAENYPSPRLGNAWQRFLGSQMHDILPGTAIPQAYAFAWNDEVVSMNEFADVATQGVGGVARAMDTRAQGVPLVVYNPLSVAREDVVEAEVALPGGAPTGVRVFGPDGRETPAQIVGRSGGKVKVLFRASVPSIGFAAYDVRPGKRATASSLKVTPKGLENTRYRVRLNANGDVASVVDKAAGKEMLSAPIRLAFQYEKPEKHPAWNMEWADRQKPPMGYVDGPAKVTVVENGPVRVALKIEREARGSKFAQIVRLASGGAGDHVEFVDGIDWRTGECSLKATFPLAVSNPMATYNWEVGTVQRGNNEPKKYEVPSHQWFDLTAPDGGYGVSVLNEAKYGSDKPDNHTLRLTLLYTPGVRDNYQHQGTQDWGHHDIRYALVGHAGDWRKGNAQSQGARFNEPLMAFGVGAHPGRLGRSLSLLKVDSPAISVAALKKAEDSDETIVRLFEMNGRAEKGVRLTAAASIVAVREVDGQEHGIPDTAPVALSQGGLTFDMAPYRPRTFAIKLGASAARLALPKSQAVKLPFNADVTSSGKGAHDGAFDAEGRTLPGELLGKEIVSGGVTFHLGPTEGDERNAVACEGQTISLPKGSAPRRLYLLAAADGADVPATFRVGGKPTTLTVQNWGGYVGQWDTRLWEGKVPDKTFGWTNPLAGVAPGFIKRDPIAWSADHWRLASGENDPYRYCYLFRYSLPVPAGATKVTLPNDRRVHVLAATVAATDDARPLQPLYDTLEGHRGFTVKK